MSSEHDNFAGPGMKNRVLELQQKTSRLVKQLDNLGVELDDLECQMKELSKELWLNASCCKPDLQKTQFQQASSAIARSAVLVWANKGVATLFIDNRQRGIGLSPRLAALVSILIEEGGIVNDRLVGWKSKQTLQAALASRLGHNYSSIKHLIHLLRKVLKRHGASADLVRFDRYLGYRFAVLRRGQSPNPEFSHRPGASAPPSGGNSAAEDA